MKTRILVSVLLIASSLSGCDSFNSSFNEQFDKQFREGCVKGATDNGAPADIATKACNCTMDKLQEGKSETEFNMPSQEEQLAAMKSCGEEMGLAL